MKTCLHLRRHFVTGRQGLKSNLKSKITNQQLPSTHFKKSGLPLIIDIKVMHGQSYECISLTSLIIFFSFTGRVLTIITTSLEAVICPSQTKKDSTSGIIFAHAISPSSKSAIAISLASFFVGAVMYPKLSFITFERLIGGLIVGLIDGLLFINND